MDCCNYPEYRAQYGWECAGGYAPYAPLPYAPYAPSYYAPHAHDPYARYAAAYHYDAYPASQHTAPTDHVTPMDYGGYATKDGRMRRTLGRREVRSRTPSHHIPLPPTPPLECGLNGRNAYCEPQIWPHYQGGVMGVGGWNGMSSFGGAWMSRGAAAACSREQMRHPPDISRSLKGSQMHAHNQVCPPEGRTTPFPVYEDQTFSGERARATPEYVLRNVSTPASVSDYGGAPRERSYAETRQPTPEVKQQPATVPLPAFQQAFGSTEIGRFAEAFSRTETALDDASSETFTFDGFSDWDGHPEPLWSSQPAAKEIKCEDNF